MLAVTEQLVVRLAVVCRRSPHAFPTRMPHTHAPHCLLSLPAAPWRHAPTHRLLSLPTAPWRHAPTHRQLSLPAAPWRHARRGRVVDVVHQAGAVRLQLHTSQLNLAARLGAGEGGAVSKGPGDSTARLGSQAGGRQ